MLPHLVRAIIVTDCRREPPDFCRWAAAAYPRAPRPNVHARQFKPPGHCEIVPTAPLGNRRRNRGLHLGADLGAQAGKRGSNKSPTADLKIHRRHRLRFAPSCGGVGMLTEITGRTPWGPWCACDPSNASTTPSRNAVEGGGRVIFFVRPPWSRRAIATLFIKIRFGHLGR
jgi:hypothetical protein